MIINNSKRKEEMKVNQEPTTKFKMAIMNYHLNLDIKVLMLEVLNQFQNLKNLFNPIVLIDIILISFAINNFKLKKFMWDDLIKDKEKLSKINDTAFSMIDLNDNGKIERN